MFNIFESKSDWKYLSCLISEEIKQLSAEKDEGLKEVENVLKEQIREHERLMQTHRFVIKS